MALLFDQFHDSVEEAMPNCNSGVALIDPAAAFIRELFMKRLVVVGKLSSVSQLTVGVMSMIRRGMPFHTAVQHMLNNNIVIRSPFKIDCLIDGNKLVPNNNLIVRVLCDTLSMTGRHYYQTAPFDKSDLEYYTSKDEALKEMLVDDLAAIVSLLFDEGDRSPTQFIINHFKTKPSERKYILESNANRDIILQLANIISPGVQYINMYSKRVRIALYTLYKMVQLIVSMPCLERYEYVREVRVRYGRHLIEVMLNLFRTIVN